MMGQTVQFRISNPLKLALNAREENTSLVFSHFSFEGMLWFRLYQLLIVFSIYMPCNISKVGFNSEYDQYSGAQRVT